MRKKVCKLVLSFSTSTQAMAAESYCRQNHIPGRLIPLPGSISAECGLAWCTALEEKEHMELLIKEKKISVQNMQEVFLYERK